MMISSVSVNRHLLVACIGVTLMLLAACGELDETPSNESGSAVFSVKWATNEDSAFNQSDSNSRAATIDCSDLGITQVLCVILNSSGHIVKTGGPWNCSLGAATITNIPVGINYRFVILARNSSNIYVQRGESNIVDISSGNVTNIGTVALDFFKPDLLNPDDTGTVNGNSTLLQWTAIENINTYQLHVSTDSNFTDLMINDKVSNTNFDLQNLQNDANYYWRVRSIDDQDHESLWSLDRSFYIEHITENTVKIEIPAKNSSFTEGELITFSGVTKVVAGSTVQSLEWKSSINFEIGSGSSINGENLSPGEHDITLTATVIDEHNIATYHDDTITVHVVEPEWLNLIGGPGEEEGVQIAIDGNDNIHITGRTSDSLTPPPDDPDNPDYINRGENDVYVAKYDKNGINIWEKLAGSTQFDRGLGIAVGPNGNVYATGLTYGQMGVIDSYSGLEDVFIVKYTPHGNTSWIRMLGSPEKEEGKAVTVGPDGFIYITGYTLGRIDPDGDVHQGGEDIFIAKLRPEDGETVWIEQFGTASNDRGEGIAIHSNELYLTGDTYGDLKGDGTTYGGRDMFIAKLSEDGGPEIWIEILGTAFQDSGEDIIVGANGDSYIAGFTRGDLDGNIHQGERDCFVTKYDTDGDNKWIKMLASAADDKIDGIAIDKNENVYVTGNTDGDLEGYTNSGFSDTIVSKFTSSGQYQWTKVEATTEHEWGVGIVISNSNDYAYITGSKDTVVNGENNVNEFDIYIWKVDLLTEP